MKSHLTQCYEDMAKNTIFAHCVEIGFRNFFWHVLPFFTKNENKKLRFILRFAPLSLYLQQKYDAMKL